MAAALALTRSDSYNYLPPNMSELRVALLGSSWSQRSSVGNLFFGEKMFDTDRQFDKENVQKKIKCIKKTELCQEKTISVINTSDLLQTDITADVMTEFSRDLAEASAPGPHVFLLVLQPEDFTEQHNSRLQSVLESFSEQAFHHSLVLLCAPQVQTPGFMDKYMRDPHIRDMIIKCSYRYLWMTYVEDDPDMTFKRKELLTRISEIIEISEEHLKYEAYEEVPSQQAETEQSSFAVAQFKSITSSIHSSVFERSTYHSRLGIFNYFQPFPRGTHHLSQESVLRLLLFGKSCDKKTRGSNLITEKKDSQSQTTKHSVAAYGEWRGQRVTVVRTPDLFSLAVKAVTEEMKRCVSLCSPGPNVLLLLVKPSEFTEKDRETLNLILSLFGPDAFKHAMVVITHDEKETSSVVNEILCDCNGRFYNMFEENRQVLMENIEKIVQQNRGSSLTIAKKTDIEDVNLIPCMNLVLCGSPRVEKSSVIKSILGRAGLPAESSPGQCVQHQGEVCGRWVSVVELPALSGKPLEAVMQQSLSCLSLCGPEGVHAFILVLPLGPLTDEDKAEIKTIQDTFSSAVNPFTMILFTVDSDPTAPAVVDSVKADTDLQELCQSCGGGYLIFNTRGQQQVPELLESVETLKATNKPQSYTTERLVQAHIEKITALQKEKNDLKNLSMETRDDNQSSDCLRIALIGKTGCGKSSSGNTILGRKMFEAKPSQTSVTRVCQKAQSTVDGRHVAVVDTPGLFDTSLSNDEVNDEMIKCISLLAPGPHVFLLVLSIGRLTQEEKETLEFIKRGFGKGAEKFTIILFTGGDELVRYNMSIQNYLETCDKSFRKLISDCGDRYHVFNNSDEDNRTQVKELLEKIDDMVKENGGHCYTNDMLLEAEAAIQKEMKRLLQEKEEEMRIKREEMETNHQQEMEDIQRKLDKQKEEIEKERQQRETELKEKEEKIKEEKEKREREQKGREEEDRKRKEREEIKRQEWEQKTKALEEKIKSEQKSRETFEMKLQESRSQMEEERGRWEEERKDWWEKRNQEDEERRQVEKKIQEEMRHILREKQLKEKELIEKEEKIKEEQKQRKREQETREEEDRKRREQEEMQQREWEQKRTALERKIKSEEQSKETSELRLEQSRKQMEEEREQWEQERKDWWQKREAENEERRQLETQMQADKNKIENEKEKMERELKDKEKLINEEKEQRKKEQEKREKEDRERREKEQQQQQEWEEKKKAMEKQIRSEQESKKTTEKALEDSKKQMKQEREQWEKERKEQEAKLEQENEKTQQQEQEEIENLRDNYNKELTKFEKEKEEQDQIRREQEAKERKELEDNHQKKIEEMETEKDGYKEEARRIAEEYNDFQRKEREKREKFWQNIHEMVKCILKNNTVKKQDEQMRKVKSEEEKQKLQEDQQKEIKALIERLVKEQGKESWSHWFASWFI